MAKIKQASHPSLARPASSSSAPAPAPGTPGYATHRSHASSSNAPPPVVLTRQERKALQDAREFGLTPGAKAASTLSRGGWRGDGQGKMSLEEEGISKLAKLAAERAGVVPVIPGARPPSGKGKEREVDSPRRQVNGSGSANGNGNGSLKKGDKASNLAGSSKGEGSSRKPLPLEPRKPREMDRISSSSSRIPSKASSSSRPTPRKRTRSPSPDSESSLDSDDLDRNERNKRRVVSSGKGRDRDRDRDERRGGGSSRGGSRGGGGGILASLGFDPYQSFSRSGKDREEYAVYAASADGHEVDELHSLLAGTCVILRTRTRTRTWRLTRRRSERKKLGRLGWPGNKTGSRKSWRGNERKRR